MKFIFCRNCGDVIALKFRPQRCECCVSFGLYNDDGDTVTISDADQCELYGLSNQVFRTGRAETWRYPVHNGKVSYAATYDALRGTRMPRRSKRDKVAADAERRADHTRGTGAGPPCCRREAGAGLNNEHNKGE